VYLTTVFQVSDLSFHRLKCSCNVKVIECLKCINCIECFILQDDFHRPDFNTEVNNSDTAQVVNLGGHRGYLRLACRVIQNAEFLQYLLPIEIITFITAVPVLTLLFMTFI
jgi:hypothetical protein